MRTSDLCLRMLAYAKASLLCCLEGLDRDDLVWQPEPGKGYIGWHACHVALLRGSLMWNFDKVPDWESLGELLAFGTGSNCDELRDQVPAKARLVELIHEDWALFVPRFAELGEADFDRPVPRNNPDGETLVEMFHRVAWHVEHHVGRLCGLRSMRGKPIFPRPTFGTTARRALEGGSETGWEKVLKAIDPAMKVE